MCSWKNTSAAEIIDAMGANSQRAHVRGALSGAREDIPVYHVGKQEKYRCAGRMAADFQHEPYRCVLNDFAVRPSAFSHNYGPVLKR